MGNLPVAITCKNCSKHDLSSAEGYDRRLKGFKPTQYMDVSRSRCLVRSRWMALVISAKGHQNSALHHEASACADRWSGTKLYEQNIQSIYRVVDHALCCVCVRLCRPHMHTPATCIPTWRQIGMSCPILVQQRSNQIFAAIRIVSDKRMKRWWRLPDALQQC